MNCAKIPYANRADAEVARRKLRAKGKAELQVYHCVHCQAFHLGRQRPRTPIPIAPPLHQRAGQAGGPIQERQ